MLRELQQSFLEAYQSALEIGDLEFTAYSQLLPLLLGHWKGTRGTWTWDDNSEAIRQLKKKGHSLIK